MPWSMGLPWPKPPLPLMEKKAPVTTLCLQMLPAPRSSQLTCQSKELTLLPQSPTPLWPPWDCRMGGFLRHNWQRPSGAGFGHATTFTPSCPLPPPQQVGIHMCARWGFLRPAWPLLSCARPPPPGCSCPDSPCPRQPRHCTGAHAVHYYTRFKASLEYHLSSGGPCSPPTRN